MAYDASLQEACVQEYQCANRDARFTRLFQQFRIYEWLALAPQTNSFCRIPNETADLRDGYSNPEENSGCVGP